MVKQAVYVLPDSAGAREDFEWLKTEIEDAGGQATVFTAASVDAWSDDALVGEFRRLRQVNYEGLAREIVAVMPPVGRRGAHHARLKQRRALAAFRQRLASLERIDFFASAGRDRVSTLLEAWSQRLEAGSSPATPRIGEPVSPDRYQRRLWVTRPRPGVDRMASAWLIGRFIDPEARFGFVADQAAAPRDAVPFDMFGADFGHHGKHCTFETLSAVFGISASGVARLAGIVHDLDLKDGRFRSPEAAAVDAVIDGLRLRYADDDTLLAQGVVLFDALYRSFEQSVRRVGPRPVAPPRATRRARKRR